MWLDWCTGIGSEPRLCRPHGMQLSHRWSVVYVPMHQLCTVRCTWGAWPQSRHLNRIVSLRSNPWLLHTDHPPSRVHIIATCNWLLIQKHLFTQQSQQDSYPSYKVILVNDYPPGLSVFKIISQRVWLRWSLWAWCCCRGGLSADLTLACAVWLVEQTQSFMSSACTVV